MDDYEILDELQEHPRVMDVLGRITLLMMLAAFLAGLFVGFAIGLLVS